ncbi:MAG: hypothetical protein PHT95_06380, partial [Candidatus Omnitrophica bacterium]|nr:hypothetical protein [Candidatus Omnitrophota bacterium]
MKKWTNLIVGVLVLVLVVSFTKDLAIRISVEKGVEAVTGLRLKLQGLSVGIIRTMVDVKGLKLYNPTGFKDRVMIDIPRIYVDYDLPAIIKGNIHLPEVILEMTEF